MSKVGVPTDSSSSFSFDVLLQTLKQSQEPWRRWIPHVELRISQELTWNEDCYIIDVTRHRDPVYHVSPPNIHEIDRIVLMTQAFRDKITERIGKIEDRELAAWIVYQKEGPQ